MRKIRISPVIAILLATLLGLGLSAAPAVGQLSAEQVCTPTQDAEGNETQVCVLGEIIKRDGLAATGSPQDIILLGLSLITLGVALKRGARRRRV